MIHSLRTRYSSMRGAVAVEYGLIAALIAVIIIIIITLLAPKPPQEDPPKDPYQAPAAQTEWTMAAAEMESMMAAQQMYMDSNGQPAPNVETLEDAGMLSPFHDTTSSSEYNYSTGPSADGFFVMAEPNPDNGSNGSNPPQPYLMYESGDTVRVEMDGPPDHDSMTMDAFLSKCFPAASDAPVSSECPPMDDSLMQQTARATGQIVSGMDEVFPPEVIANPYHGMDVTDRDKFLDMVVSMTMNKMDRLDGHADGVFDMEPGMQNLHAGDLIDLEHDILDKMGMEQAPANSDHTQWISGNVNIFKVRVKKGHRNHGKARMPMGKAKKRQVMRSIKSMLPYW